VATGSRPLSLVVRRRRFARANLTPVGFSLPRPSFRDFADLMAPASPNYVGCELLIEFARLRFGSAVGAASAASARRTLGTTSGSRCAPSRASRRSPSTPMKSAACLARRAAPAVAVVLSLAHATPGRGGPRPPARVGPATNGAHRQPAHCTPPYAPSTPQRIGDEGHRNIERAHSAPCLSPCSDSPSPRVPILPAHGVASSVAFSLACAAPLPVGVLLVVTPGVASLTLGALRCAPRFVSSMRPGVQRFCPRPPRHGSPRAITAATIPSTEAKTTAFYCARTLSRPSQTHRPLGATGDHSRRDDDLPAFIELHAPSLTVTPYDAEAPWSASARAGRRTIRSSRTENPASRVPVRTLAPGLSQRVGRA
jgi:hypothetical protein